MINELMDRTERELAEKIVKAVIDDLRQRGGFKYILESLEDDIRIEMIDELEETVLVELRK